MTLSLNMAAKSYHFTLGELIKTNWYYSEAHGSWDYSFTKITIMFTITLPITYTIVLS